jgi:hypothetical protein
MHRGQTLEIVGFSENGHTNRYKPTYSSRTFQSPNKGGVYLFALETGQNFSLLA